MIITLSTSCESYGVTTVMSTSEGTTANRTEENKTEKKSCRFKTKTLCK